MRQSAIPPVAALLLALLAAGPAQATDYGYRVLDQKPQPRDHFVQGLQIVDGKLYVSTGRYGESRLLRYNFADSRLEGGRKLHPRLWGEGLTVLGDTLYQLTWRARLLLVYDRPDLDYRESFALPGEGWGITHNGRELIYSDGSHRLHYLAPDSGEYLRSITVTENGMPVPELNELEWVDGTIWANVFRTDRIVIIDPDTGAVTGGIDLTGLLPAAERRPDTSVLNGIAVDPADDGIWVTGKRWPWIYRIELVEPDESSGTRTSGTRTSGTRTSGTRSSGTRSSGTRSSGTNSSGAAASKPSPHSVSPPE